MQLQSSHHQITDTDGYAQVKIQLTCKHSISLTFILAESRSPLHRLPHTWVSYISQPLQVFYFRNSVHEQLKFFTQRAKKFHPQY